MTRINVFAYDEITNEKHLAGWFDNNTLVEDIKEDTYWDGNNNRGVMSGLQIGDERLMRTKGGRWVTRRDARNEFNGGLTYEFLTDEQAREWLLKDGDDEIAEKYFGEVEDERGPGRPEVGKPINVRFGDELLARVDAAAAERGKSRADTLRELVAQALGRLTPGGSI